MTTDITPPAGYTMRRPTPDDLAAVVGFLEIVTIAERGAPDFPEEELRGHWAALALETDAWLVTAPDDGIVGYAALHHLGHAVLQAEGYVHPTHARRGIGAYLLRATESRAHEHVAFALPGVQVLLYNAVNAHNPSARHLLEGAGFAADRHFWRMTIDLEVPFPPPVWPTGITVRPWESESDDHPMYLALEEAFSDHWAHVPTDFTVWRQKKEHFDPGLWLLACDGQDIAGALIGRHHIDMGWIDQLGVRRSWRQRGIGLALLRESFAACARRGWTRVGLDVDSESETGATRLYERAGMRIAPDNATAVYRKELRPGHPYVPRDTEE